MGEMVPDWNRVLLKLLQWRLHFTTLDAAALSGLYKIEWLRNSCRKVEAIRSRRPKALGFGAFEFLGFRVSRLGLVRRLLGNGLLRQSS